MQRIQIVLKSILLRRTKDSVDKNGRPILKLPEKEVILVQTPFRDPYRPLRLPVRPATLLTCEQ